MRRASLLVATSFAALFACRDDDGAMPSSDAGADGGTPPTDAGAETTNDGGPTFCTGQTADFCADFDQGSTPGTGWSGVATSGAGALALEPATETSKPNALKASLPALDGSKPNGGSAQVARQDVPLGGKTKVTIALRANIGDAKPTDANHLMSFLTLKADLGTIALFRGDQRWFVSVARKSAAGGNDVAERTLKVTPALDKWVKLELEVVLGRPNGSVKLLVDGQEAVNETIATIGDAPPSKDDVTLAVGPIHAAGASAAFDARFDDVTLTLAP